LALLTSGREWDFIHHVVEALLDRDTLIWSYVPVSNEIVQLVQPFPNTVGKDRNLAAIAHVLEGGDVVMHSVYL
jgi:hypothetical protein